MPAHAIQATPPTDPATAPASAQARQQQIGCVAYLNSKPLIHGLKDTPDHALRLAVPADLLQGLESDELDIALCPVIDYFRSKTPLTVVPVGCIASDGPTMTVKLFSKVPIEQITEVHADTDSHTSVALLSVLLNELYDLRPKITPYNSRAVYEDQADAPQPQAVLLIGDKVFHQASQMSSHPYQLDFGEAWKKLTGMPFMFAVWMARRGEALGDLPDKLTAQLETNLSRMPEVIRAHAGPQGWSESAASEYLLDVIKFRVQPEHLEAMRRFAEFAAKLGLIDEAHPIELYK